MFIDRPCGRWVPPISGTPATRGVALATASCNAPKDRVSSASAHAGPTRRTAALDGFQRSPSLRRSPDGASRAGSPSTVVRRSPWVASPRRRLNRRSPARARVASATGSLRAGKIWIPLHGIILPPAAGGEPLLSCSRQKGRNACCVPAQVLSPLARSGSRAPCAQVPRTPSSPSLSRAA